MKSKLKENKAENKPELRHLYKQIRKFECPFWFDGKCFLNENGAKHYINDNFTIVKK